MTTFNWPKIDLSTLRAHRSAHIRELLAKWGCDHLLLTGTDNIRYAVDFRAQLISEAYDWYAAIVDKDGLADVLVPHVDERIDAPFRELPWIRSLRPLPSWAPALSHPMTWVRALAEVLEERRARNVGYDALPAPLFHDLERQRPERHWCFVGLDLYSRREVKHPLEVELLEAASHVNDLALHEAVHAARVGVTDHELLAEAMRVQQRLGAEFICHSVCNLKKESGSWFADGTTLQRGDAFFLDVGCYGQGGYATDMARTGFLGEPSKRTLEAYRHLLRAHELAQELARPGQKASAVFAAVNQYLEGVSLGRTPYSVGHGVGLRACELPTLYRADLMDRDTTLQKGHVIALEPETSFEDADGKSVVLKLEEIFVIEEDGARRLSPVRNLEDLVVGA